jgi:hypothetical protein
MPCLPCLLTPSTPCHPTPFHPIPSHAIPCHPIPSHAILWHPIPCHPMPCHAIPCQTDADYSFYALTSRSNLSGRCEKKACLTTSDLNRDPLSPEFKVACVSVSLLFAISSLFFAPPNVFKHSATLNSGGREFQTSCKHHVTQAFFSHWPGGASNLLHFIIMFMSCPCGSRSSFVTWRLAVACVIKYKPVLHGTWSSHRLTADTWVNHGTWCSHRLGILLASFWPPFGLLLAFSWASFWASSWASTPRPHTPTPPQPHSLTPVSRIIQSRAWISFFCDRRVKLVKLQ